MSSALRITVLVENHVGRRGLLAEHGLALWVEARGRNILFDTGQGLALGHNAEHLGIDLRQADAVVLSHGHYDHTGGLAAEASRFSHANLYAHPAAFERRFSVGGEAGMQSTSPAIQDVDQLREHVRSVTFTNQPTELADGVWVTGEIPRRNAFEDTGGRFHLDAAQTRPDPLLDDQAMYVECPDGVVVILGCAHAGVVNTLDYVAELTGRPRFLAVLGGMHLLHGSEQRLAATIAALQQYDIQTLAPAHCTGWAATLRLWTELPGRCVECRTGDRFEFETDPD